MRKPFKQLDNLSKDFVRLNNSSNLAKKLLLLINVSPAIGHRKLNPEGKFMTFDQFTEAMAKSVFILSEGEKKEQIWVYAMADEELEEEEY